jgi:hypothetical protein
MIDPIRFSIEEEARSLAASNAEADPDVQEIWWFPDKEEIRFIEIDTTLPQTDGIAAFAFPSSPIDGLHFPFAVGLIRPEDKKLPLPEGWGNWDDAVLLYSREEGTSGE